MINVTREVDRHRFLAALNHEVSDGVPYFDPEFAPNIVSAVLGREVSGRSYLLPAGDYVEFLQRAGVDMAYLAMPLDFGRKRYVDESGRSQYLDGILKSREDLSSAALPNLDPVKRRIEEFLDKADGTGLGWIYALPSSEDVIGAVGYEDYFIKLLDDPGFIVELMDRYEEHCMAMTDMVLYYAPDAVVLRSSLCCKSGLCVGMEQAEKFVFSRMRRQMAVIKAAAVPAILHSDGDNTPVMDEWIELGFAGIHPVEPCGEFDIYKVKQRWGDRIALFGNIEVGGVLTRGTPEDVAKDTLLHLDRLSTGGGYICGSSHDIDDSVPVENLCAMVETVMSWKAKPAACL